MILETTPYEDSTTCSGTLLNTNESSEEIDPEHRHH